MHMICDATLMPLKAGDIVSYYRYGPATWRFSVARTYGPREYGNDIDRLVVELVAPGGHLLAVWADHVRYLGGRLT